MNVLVLNCGSSSIKFQVLKMPEEKMLVKGIVERIGEPMSIIEGKTGEKKKRHERPVADHTEGIKEVLALLTDPELSVMKSVKEISAIGHRVVHGGETYSASVLITDAVITAIEDNIPLAPLHNPANLKGILACRETVPGIPQSAVFDTAFHQSMPDYAYLYAIPKSYYEKYKIRRFGFHGTSHKFVAHRAGDILKKPLSELKLITAHLGNGASITAVDRGRSVDTSMGFTPLEGLIMGTRSGDLDPAITVFLQRNEHIDCEEIDRLLNKKSGLIGLFEKSNDMRIIEEEYFKGDALAKLVLTMYAYRIVKYIGAYMAAMGGADALIYTAGVGENTPPLREIAADFLGGLGFGINKELNNEVIRKQDYTDISAEGASVKTIVIPTNEELAIARDTFELLQGRSK